MFLRPSLGQLLSLLLFLFATISAVSIGIMWTTSVWNREVQTVQDQHLQLARHLAEGLDRYAEDVEAVFQLAVLNLVRNQPTPNLNTLLRRLHFKHICIVNSTGEVKQLISTRPAPHIERIPRRLLTKLGIGQAEAKGPPTLSNVLPDRNGKPTLYLWHPLRQDRYALGALDTTYFVQLQQSISFGQKGHAAIVDRTGAIIAHPNPKWQATMKDLSDLDPVRRMRIGETGVSWFFSPAVQAPMVAGFTTTPRTGWGVMVPQPVSELEVRVSSAKRVIWSVVGAILLSSAILGGLVSHWLAAQLNRIGATAERFASGCDTARVGELGAFQTREAAGLATQFNAMADEVTRSWQARRESEERFRSLLEGSIQGIIIHRDFKPLFVNHAYARMHGYDTVDDILRMETILPLAAPHEQARWRQYKDARLRGAEAPTEYEYQAVRQDGSWTWIDNKVRVVSWDGAPAIQSTAFDISERKQGEAVLRDMYEALEQRAAKRTVALQRANTSLEAEITERQQVEAALLVSEARFRAAFETAAIGMAQASLDGRMMTTNKAMQQMLGYSSNELHGMLIEEITHPEDAALHLGFFSDARAGVRDSYEAEKRYCCKDGKVIWGHVTVSLVRDNAGKPAFTIGLIVDITERKRLDAQLQQSERLGSLGTFAAGMAHELNNPLAAIQITAEHAQDAWVVRPEQQVVHDCLSDILDDSQRCAQIVKRVLHFARPTNRVKSQVALHALIQMALTHTQRYVEQKGGRMDLTFASEQPTIIAHEDEIELVLINLIRNAVEASRPGGSIAIRTEVCDREVQVAVQDFGSGLSEAERQRVFDPFYTTRETSGGTGLGLSIVHRIITDHDGRIALESSMGQGTTVQFRLPLAPLTLE